MTTFDCEMTKILIPKSKVKQTIFEPVHLYLITGSTYGYHGNGLVLCE